MIAIVGGGIAGLAAAFELQRRGTPLLLLEASPRLGGVVMTERAGEFLLDAGADSFLTQKPAALALCDELGLRDRVMALQAPSTAFILRGGQLHPLPPSSVLGLPIRARDLGASRLFSVRGKARILIEPWLPRAPSRGDESIGAFMRRRFGREAVTYVAEPLLAGIHVGDVERLSMRALFPRFVEAESRFGSVLRGLRAQSGGTHEPGFRTLAGGLQTMIDAMAAQLPPSSLRLEAPVASVEAHERMVVGLERGEPIACDAAILTVPAHAAAAIVVGLDASLAALLRRIQYASSATVLLAYPRAAVRHPLAGSGFVVPRAERRVSITAASWLSSKWADRAPAGFALVRAFLAGTRTPALLEAGDDRIVDVAHGDLAKLLAIGGTPTLARVYRWTRATPQHEVGHADLVAEIDRQLARHPRLFLAGSGYRGTGIPDVIADARETAGRAAAAVGRRA
jgi:oxygen-dependent protoporphyrinogen oxidase